MDICYPDSADWGKHLTDVQTESMDADEKALAEAFAWSLLASLTGHRIGTCPITIRPCAARCAPAGTWLVAPVGRASTAALGGRIGSLNPYISGGVWYNACGCGPRGCDCDSLPAVELPGPVGRVIRVAIGEDVLDPSAYRVDTGVLLVRTDGEAWPACNDGTFEVTYYRGAPPNALTNRAAGLLAYEFFRSARGQECRLPENVIRASRGGESYEFEPTDFPEGRTGIPEVNAVIRIYNPYGSRAPVSMASPDTIDVGAGVSTWRRR